MPLHESWRTVLQECVKTTVTAAAVIGMLLVTARDPSTDDAVRGLVAGVIGSLCAKLSRQWV